MEIKMNVNALQTFLIEVFPQVHTDFQVLDVTPKGVCVKLIISDQHLRPGGTISGPTIFALADIGMYLAVLSRIGPQSLAVTTNCSIDFMRKPASKRNLVCDVVLYKIGRVLAVGECLIYSEGVAAPVARASLTYSLPQNNGVI